ncbi:MAG: thioredoxin family protein [Candidatus Peregrinibacteria bacterium]|nr:thioredoxin family protein [Candidatus Peregrinibacteria bacterium]
MEQELTNNRDLSWYFIIPIILGSLLLAGCSSGSTATTPNTQHGAMMEDDKMEGESMMMEDDKMEGESMMMEDLSYQLGVMQPYSEKAVAAALEDGKRVLLDFYATWCPVCRRNKPLLSEAIDGSGMVAGFTVDYDKAQDLRVHYGVTYHSTYIVLDQKGEIGRLSGAQTIDSFKELMGG